MYVAGCILLTPPVCVGLPLALQYRCHLLCAAGLASWSDGRVTPLSGRDSLPGSVVVGLAPCPAICCVARRLKA